MSDYAYQAECEIWDAIAANEPAGHPERDPEPTSSLFLVEAELVYDAASDELTPAAPCAWFAGCDRLAVTSVPHPVLGDVPCCQRCADFATS